MEKILLIEDDGVLTRDLIEELETQGYEVVSAYSYVSAIGLWEKYKGQFDCIILDLNINPNGLDVYNVNRYFPIQGILILNEICKEKNDEEAKKIWSKTIVYSGYIDILRGKGSEFLYYDSLKLISKRGTSISKLLQKVNEIFK